jgi:hypothetical protein
MEIFIKLASRDYEKLRSRIPDRSPAHEAIEKATWIDYSLDGVLFEGRSIPCDARQARTLLEIARQSCPEIVPKIQEAMRLAGFEQS